MVTDRVMNTFRRSHAGGSLNQRLTYSGTLLVVLALFVLSCVTTGPGGKKSFILISDQQESSLGKSVAEEVLKTEKPLEDSLWQAYLTEVGEKIVRVSDRSNLPFHFTVLDNDQINAFATPGGYLFFYTGILRMMESEDELAAVMAHEISHVVGRHSVKTIQTYYGGAIALSLLLGDDMENEVGRITSLVFGLALQGYGRKNEHEADEFGLHYMAKASYNPNGAVTMFEKLASFSGEKKRGFFENLTATHPETRERISRMKTQIAALPSEYTSRPIKKNRYDPNRRSSIRIHIPPDQEKPLRANESPFAATERGRQGEITQRWAVADLRIFDSLRMDRVMSLNYVHRRV